MLDVTGLDYMPTERIGPIARVLSVQLPSACSNKRVIKGRGPLIIGSSPVEEECNPVWKLLPATIPKIRDIRADTATADWLQFCETVRMSFVTHFTVAQAK